MSTLHPLVVWQREFAAQPQVWTVSVNHEDTGNLYDSKEAAQLEVNCLKRQGFRSARVRSAGNIHNMKLSRERWVEDAIWSPPPVKREAL